MLIDGIKAAAATGDRSADLLDEKQLSRIFRNTTTVPGVPPKLGDEKPTPSLGVWRDLQIPPGLQIPPIPHPPRYIQPPFLVRTWRSDVQKETLSNPVWMHALRKTKVEELTALYNARETFGSPYQCFLRPNQDRKDLEPITCEAFMFANIFEKEWTHRTTRSLQVQLSNITLDWLQQMVIMLQFLNELMVFVMDCTDPERVEKFKEFRFFWKLPRYQWTQGLEWRLRIQAAWTLMYGLTFISRLQWCGGQSTHTPHNLGCLPLDVAKTLCALHSLGCRTLKILSRAPEERPPDLPGEMDVGIIGVFHVLLHARLFELAFLGHHYDGVMVQPPWNVPKFASHAQPVEFECARMYDDVLKEIQVLRERGEELWSRVDTAELRTLYYNYERHSYITQIRFFWSKHVEYHQSDQFVKSIGCLTHLENWIVTWRAQYERQCRLLGIKALIPTRLLSLNKWTSVLEKDDTDAKWGSSGPRRWLNSVKSWWTRLRQGPTPYESVDEGEPLTQADVEIEDHWNVHREKKDAITGYRAADKTSTMSLHHAVLHDLWPMNDSVNHIDILLSEFVKPQLKIYAKAGVKTQGKLAVGVFRPPHVESSPTLCFWTDTFFSATRQAPFGPEGKLTLEL